MRMDEFPRQELSCGVKVHFSRGMRWRETKPFYYGPVHRRARAKQGITSPCRLKAMAGYQHGFFPGNEGNAVIPNYGTR